MKRLLILILLLVSVNAYGDSFFGGGGGNGSMTYPSGTGLAVVTSGTSWGTTITPGTGVATALAAGMNAANGFELYDSTILTAASTLDATKLSGTLPALNGGSLTGVAAATVASGATGVTPSAGDNSTKVATTAYVDTATNTTNTGAGATTAVIGYNWNNYAGAHTFNLPAIAAGQQFCFGSLNTKAYAITIAINTQSGVSIYYKGVGGTASTGTLVSGGAAGDFICLEAASATTYMATGAGQGTWTNN